MIRDLSSAALIIERCSNTSIVVKIRHVQTIRRWSVMGYRSVEDMRGCNTIELTRMQGDAIRKVDNAIEWTM
jgi:hypothetical protein